MDKQTGINLIRAAVERGVTLFDTAETYGLYGPGDGRFEERPEPKFSSQPTRLSDSQLHACAALICGRIEAFNRSSSRRPWDTSTAESSRKLAVSIQAKSCLFEIKIERRFELPKGTFLGYPVSARVRYQHDGHTVERRKYLM